MAEHGLSEARIRGFEGYIIQAVIDNTEGSQPRVLLVRRFVFESEGRRRLDIPG